MNEQVEMGTEEVPTSSDLSHEIETQLEDTAMDTAVDRNDDMDEDRNEDTGDRNEDTVALTAEAETKAEEIDYEGATQLQV